ncbi:putative homing endonuclease [Tuber indicum]|nr:putative homing endonuclease [Tuber indicum]
MIKNFNKYILQGYLFGQQNCYVSTTSINTSSSSVPILDPFYITGLVDDPKRTVGYVITVAFELSLYNKDIYILKGLQAYFGVGKIYKNADNMMHYKVSSIKDLQKVVIPHFEKYPLVTQKRADFEILKCVIGILNKGPLTSEDLKQIINLKASLNKGLPDKLKVDFPDIISVCRPPVKFLGIPDSNWLCGFVEAEGCFYISIYKSPKSKLGMAVQLVFVVTQHIRDKELIEGLKEYLNCGKFSVRKGNEACDYKVTSLADINEKIVPFFLKFPLTGTKSLNFKDFLKVVNIMNEKGHLTASGLKTIENIKVGMNTGRS